MSKPVALIVGGSKWHARIIGAARALGCTAIVTDISPTAPGRELADVFVEIDTNDREGLLAVAHRHGVSLVLFDQSDRTVSVAAWLNERLGTPGLRPETAHRFTNKLAMRRSLAGSPVAMPASREVSTIEDAELACAEWGYPVVVKPKDQQASVGVFKAADVVALRRAVPATLAHSRDGRFLIERFIEGTEITVEGLSLDGRPTVLAISEKAHYAFNDCIAYRLAYPPRFEADLIERIRSTAKETVRILGLDTGFFHGEFRVRDGVPYLIEIAARGAGNGVATLIAPHVSGIDPYALFLRRLLGERVELPPLRHRAGLLEFLQFEPGVVKRIHGLDQVREERLAAQIDLSFKEGDTIAQPTSDRNRLGQFIVLADDRDEVDRIGARIKELVRVEYEGSSTGDARQDQ